MANQNKDYTQIDDPFTNQLKRVSSVDKFEVEPTEGIGSPNQMKGNVVDGSSISDCWIKNFIKSTNYKVGTTGFLIDGITGKVEFGDGYFRGDITGASGIFSGIITATAGSIGGWTISADALYLDGATDAVSSGMASGDYPFYAGKKYADRATAPFKVEPSGKLTASDIVATGVINAQSGYLSSGVYVDTVNGILCESGGLNVGNAGHIRGGQTDYATGTGFFLGYSGAAYKFSIGNTTDYLRWDGSNVKMICSAANAIEIKYGSDILLEHGGDIKFTSVTAPTACTATLAATAVGNVDAGIHSYKVTYVNGVGETELGTISNTVTNDATHKQNALSNIPVSTSGSVIARKIYRTKAGRASYYLLTTISNNTTTTYTDNTADASLTGGIANYKDNDSFGKIIVDDDVRLNIADVNIFIGTDAGKINETGWGNLFIGKRSGEKNIDGYANICVGGLAGGKTTGVYNTFLGYQAGYTVEEGSYNTCIGEYSGGAYLRTGNNNTFVGGASGYNNNGSNNVFLGYLAGQYETGSNRLFIDNQTRTNEADGRIKALIYGIFNATPTSQILQLNAAVVCGTNAALATNATDGFLNIPTCAGVPTGTPTAYTGKVAMIYDTTNNDFYLYNGAWKKVALT